MVLDFESIIVIAGIVVAFFVLIALGRLVFGNKSDTTSSIHQPKRCVCGWEGLVSKYVNKCPKCGESL